MKQTILNLWQENRTLSMIVETQIIMQQMKLPIILKFWNLIFMITTMLTI